jgi:alpha-ketoglutarate-dependent taurine dioxygenase
MSNPEIGKPTLKKLGDMRRKAVDTTQAALIKVGLLEPDHPLPLLIQPAVQGVDLIGWAANNRELIENYLMKHGGILFRNFNLHTPDDFEQFVSAVSGELLEYRERSSPRSQVSGNVYTSTEHPADQTIFLHNENSYQHTWPLRIFFFCAVAPQDGGETPIADVRKVFERIDPDVRTRFAEKQVMYVRNFGDGLGMSWQTVFQTNDQAAVDEYCHKTGLDVEWKDGNRLRTRRVGQAVARHPRTGEMVWFNHATFFHVSTLEPAIRKALLTQFKEEDLPSNSFYGDSSPIEPEVLDQLRQAYQDETVTFRWQKGDVLMLDNMLVAHGRAPFSGPRKILAGMANPTTLQDIEDQARGSST